MMRKLLFVVIGVTFLVQGCSLNDGFIDEQIASEKEIVREDIDFPKQVEAFGKGVAKEIEVTVGKLNDLNVDYSEIASSKNFREKFYDDWYNANPTIAKSRTVGTTHPLDMMSAIELIERYNSLTNKQLDFIREIISECKKSKSDQDLLDRLIDLNEEIHSQVPEIEQERLLNIIAVLYYGLQKVSYLENQGLMLKTPYNSIKITKVKTRSGDVNVGSILGYCRDLTGTVWGIALAEPTPYGEVGATIGTALIYIGAAATIIYEVVSCDEYEEGGTITGTNTQYNIGECIEFYDQCQRMGGWQSTIWNGSSECKHCLDDCRSNGTWNCQGN